MNAKIVVEVPNEVLSKIDGLVRSGIYKDREEFLSEAIWQGISPGSKDPDPTDNEDMERRQRK